MLEIVIVALQIIYLAGDSFLPAWFKSTKETKRASTSRFTIHANWCWWSEIVQISRYTERFKIASWRYSNTARKPPRHRNPWPPPRALYPSSLRLLLSWSPSAHLGLLRASLWRRAQGPGVPPERRRNRILRHRRGTLLQRRRNNFLRWRRKCLLRRQRSGTGRRGSSRGWRMSLFSDPRDLPLRTWRRSLTIAMQPRLGLAPSLKP